MNQKTIWITGAVIGTVIVVFFLFISLGGLYTITSPNGPVDAAYKMNRLTGSVWLVKTYTKQVGDLRVLTAREAEVESTKQLTQADLPAVAMQEAPGRALRR
jgi:hypothetical protein